MFGWQEFQTMRKSTQLHVCVIGALLSMTLPTTPVSAAEHSSANAAVERLTFPEPIAAATPKVTYAAGPAQAPVALPTPHFTGFTAVAAMAAMLACRKRIFRLVYR
jgi:hypothetical protein